MGGSDGSTGSILVIRSITPTPTPTTPPCVSCRFQGRFSTPSGETLARARASLFLSDSMRCDGDGDTYFRAYFTYGFVYNVGRYVYMLQNFPRRVFLKPHPRPSFFSCCLFLFVISGRRPLPSSPCEYLDVVGRYRTKIAAAQGWFYSSLLSFFLINHESRLA